MISIKSATVNLALARIMLNIGGKVGGITDGFSWSVGAATWANSLNPFS